MHRGISAILLNYKFAIITHMIKNQLVNAKYVFIDVIGYSEDRPSEAQVDITSSFNSIIRDSIAKNKLITQRILFIPTGDGICIVLKDLESDLYDAHIKLALTILEKLKEYNEKINDRTRKYSIRLGLNENVDNLIIDINGNSNVSGAGINLCQRIMDSSGHNQIMLGPQVYEILSKHEKYFGSFRCFENIPIKHGNINIYQFLDHKLDNLNNDIPPKLVKIEKKDQKLPEITATFLSILHNERDKLIKLTNTQGNINFEPISIVALWFLANDLYGKSKETETKPYLPVSPYDSLDEFINCLGEIKFKFVNEFSRLIKEQADFSSWIYLCTEKNNQLFLNEYGLKKLQKDWPQILKRFCP